jgi:opacity protein-like surface antigen
MRSRLLHGARAVLVLVFLGAAATPARADWLLTPYVGITFNGDADFGDVGDFEDNIERKVTFGGSLAWMGAGIVGFEVDLGTTPNFFEDTFGDNDFEFGDSNVTTFMGNVVVGAPIGGQTGVGFRPYASGGVGLLRTNLSASDFFDDLGKNSLGVNVGGGAHIFFADNIGIRGDIRYFRSLQDDDDDDDDLVDFRFSDFDFWRATVGVTFRFGG